MTRAEQLAALKRICGGDYAFYAYVESPFYGHCVYHLPTHRRIWQHSGTINANALDSIERAIKADQDAQRAARAGK